MSAGQRSGTAAKTELDDEKVRKDDILNNRGKQRPVGRGLDGKGVRVDEYKDTQTNRQARAKSRDDKPDEATESAHVDRPGFDLGGSTGETDAGKGLGLGEDAKKNRRGWRLRRAPS